MLFFLFCFVRSCSYAGPAALAGVVLHVTAPRLDFGSSDAAAHWQPSSGAPSAMRRELLASPALSANNVAVEDDDLHLFPHRQGDFATN